MNVLKYTFYSCLDICKQCAVVALEQEARATLVAAGWVMSQLFWWPWELGKGLVLVCRGWSRALSRII